MIGRSNSSKVKLQAYQGNAWRDLRLDKATHTLQTIDYAHHEIHAGSHYFYTDGIQLADAGSQQYMITTPNTTSWAHLLFSVSLGLAGIVQLSEGADRNGSSAQTELNSDRNSSNTATTTIDKGVAGGSTDGTVIWDADVGSAAAGFRAGGNNRTDEEIILKQNTKYILTITSQANSNNIFVLLDWYEHTNKV